MPQLETQEPSSSGLRSGFSGSPLVSSPWIGIVFEVVAFGCGRKCKRETFLAAPETPPQISYPIVGAWFPKRDTGVKDLVFLARGCGLAMFSLPSLVSLWALTALGSFRNLEQVYGPDSYGWSIP